MIYAMDLTPLIREPAEDILSYVRGFTDRFAQEVLERVDRLLGDAGQTREARWARKPARSPK